MKRSRSERYKQNHDLGPKFVSKTDGVGGLVVPPAAMKRLKNGTITVDGIQYPFVVYEGQKFPVIKAAQGWTIGGKNAEKQHSKNVSEVNRITHS